jgi:hypothetical protein
VLVNLRAGQGFHEAAAADAKADWLDGYLARGDALTS